ncbi:hypothetical protein PPTG_18576 [Phytophthora nicotianae INRA-310]|uniref:Uncharacterized protein n=1 Tax=Phytophthora nicotianae (strain INRA-310) TaxID=761204 RepID=W2PFE4_PHYN3|nr:hypothetical protein PPTG_18576 [Phytophthora nicotianae INRA-310]ETM99350.1 hypothetical protein PPTG_18576 [Phytophthora nicotianae INRA-310]
MMCLCYEIKTMLRVALLYRLQFRRLHLNSGAKLYAWIGLTVQITWASTLAVYLLQVQRVVVCLFLISSHWMKRWEPLRLFWSFFFNLSMIYGVRLRQWSLIKILRSGGYWRSVFRRRRYYYVNFTR